LSYSGIQLFVYSLPSDCEFRVPFHSSISICQPKSNH
jgi:hypothetical protein